MKHWLSLPLLLTLAACTPALNQSASKPGAAAAVAPIIQTTLSTTAKYKATPLELFKAIVPVLTNDGGVPDYRLADGLLRVGEVWNVIECDPAKGAMCANAESKVLHPDSKDSGQRETHTLKTQMQSSGNTTAITITPSERAVYMRDKIILALDKAFLRVP